VCQEIVVVVEVRLELDTVKLKVEDVNDALALDKLGVPSVNEGDDPVKVLAAYVREPYVPVSDPSLGSLATNISLPP